MKSCLGKSDDLTWFDFLTNCSCAKAARSLTAEYGIREGGAIYVHASTASAHSTAVQQHTSIQALAGKAVGQLTVLSPDQEQPGNCAIYTASSSLTVLLDVSSKLADVNEEISKLKRKVGKLQEAASKLRDLLATAGFEEKVSETVRLAEKQKLDDAELAIKNYERTMEQFQRIKI
jgi:valyl-tRNA synthetase